jgi:hypothetical protein
MTINDKVSPIASITPTKHCPRCRTHRETTWFSVDLRRPDGLCCWCKPCSRAAWRERKWGIDQDEVERILKAQGGRCAICPVILDVDGADTSRSATGIRIDRGEDGRVRGFLCGECRTGLRGFGGDVDRLRGAVGYLAPKNPPSSVTRKKTGTGLS